MKAILKQYRQSPRKVRLLAGVIRGKSVEKALAELRFVPKRASGVIEKLIKSAISNAETNHGKIKGDLFIKEIRVDEGVTLKRMRPRSRGRGSRINKRTSHIILELGERKEIKNPKKQENKKLNKQETTETKKQLKTKKITKKNT